MDQETERLLLDRDPLVDAAFNGNIEEVRRLIGMGHDVNTEPLHRYTPLHAAIENVEPDVVRLLLASGANVNLQGSTKWSPIFHAVEIACEAAHQRESNDLSPAALSVIELLLDHGADVNIPSEVVHVGRGGEKIIGEKFPWTVASDYGHTALTEILHGFATSRGADDVGAPTDIPSDK